MSGFWKHYANFNDDVRHKLIEEGWFGKQVTGDAVTADVAAQEQKADQPGKETRHPLYEQVWGKGPTHADIYGKGPAVDAPAVAPPEPTQQEAGPAPEL